MTVLAGLRVLDLTLAWAGPLAGRFLGDLGAEVIHIERPSGRAGPRHNDARPPWQWGELPAPATRAAVYPDDEPGERPWNRSGVFNKINRNKRSLCLDLKHPDGAEVFRRLVAVSDVVVENNSARAMPGLGFDYAALQAINPRLVMLSMPGFGTTGPYADWLSLGPILEAASGLAGVTGYPDGGPLKLGVAFPDAIGGLHATVAIMAALWEREETGRGCFVDLSQQETYAAIGGDLILAASMLGRDPERLGNRSAVHAPQGVYPCAGEDTWVAITVRSDREWRAFRSLLPTSTLSVGSFDTLASRQAEHDAIDEAVATWTRTQSSWEVTERLTSLGIPAAPALTNADLVNDPHLASRAFFVEIDQPDVGVRRFPGFPIHFSETPVREFRGAAPLGADNETVLRDLLDMSADEIAELEAGGVLRSEPRLT